MSKSSSRNSRGRRSLATHGAFRSGTCGLLLGALALSACGDEARFVAETEPDGAPEVEPDSSAVHFVSGVKLGVYGDNGLGTNNVDGRSGSSERVLRQEGDRLYTLSGNQGLAVIDVSDPSAPRIAGRHWSLSRPFELLAENGIVFALHDAWPSYECTQQTGSCSWQFASRLQALDTRDPAQISVLSDVSIPGTLAAVQRAGHVLYVVASEQEDCHGCEAERNYTVTAFDVLDPANVQVLDQLRVFIRRNAFGPTVATGEQRLYIATADGDPRDAGSVQVVDISDPGGALVEGARFDIQAALSHPSQLQEQAGILRIINWPIREIDGEVGAPVAQSFRISSSSDVQPAGSLTVQVAAPSFQGDVRWQGTHAYLSMAEQVIALDLDDPDQPRQAATLDLPGHVYGVEPQGDRLLVVTQTGLWLRDVQVSSFDVSTLAQPTLLDRESIDGAVVGSPRYTLFPEQGLLALPLGDDSAECSVARGIWLVDTTSRDLLPRGLIADEGGSQLLFLQGERLFNVGSQHLESFDIENRDAPLSAGRLDLLHPTSAVQPLGEHLLRLGNDRASGRMLLQVMPLHASEDAAPQGQLELGLLASSNPSCARGDAWLGGELFSKGEHVYLPFATPPANAGSLAISVRHVDVSDPNAPQLVGQIGIGEAPVGGSSYRLLQQTDDLLLIGFSRSEGPLAAQVEHAYFDILDLSDPAQPQLAPRFELPDALVPGWGEIPGGVTLEQRGGWRDSSDRTLLTDGNLLITQHRVPVPDSSDIAAYYLDRLDLSDPYQPHLLPAINIPGAALYFNQQTGDLLTFDAAPTTASNSLPTRSVHWLTVSGNHAEPKDQVLLDGERRLHALAVSQNNLFYTTVGAANDVRLEALRLEAGELLRLPGVALPRSHAASATLFAHGERVFDVAQDRLRVIDLVDPDAPRITTPPLPNWPCSSLQLSANTLYCADSFRGLDRIELGPTP